MCIIINKPTIGVLPKHVIKNSIEKNPHGMGFIDLDTGKLFKTSDKNKMKLLLKQKSPFIAHCRYATVGGINRGNIHPFRFELDGGSGGLLFQNGTVDGFADYRSDSANMADLISMVKKKQIRNFLESFESRFLIYWDSGRVEMFGDWTEKHGAFFSKDNVLVKEQQPVYLWGNRYYSNKKYWEQIQTS